MGMFERRQNKNTGQLNQKPYLERFAGFSLTEMIIAIAIMALLAGGIAAVFIKDLDIWQSHWKQAQDSQEVNMALARITQDIRNATYGIILADANNVSMKDMQTNVVSYQYNSGAKTLSRNGIVILGNISNFQLYYFDNNNNNLSVPMVYPMRVVSLVSIRIQVGSVDLFTAVKSHYMPWACGPGVVVRDIDGNVYPTVRIDTAYGPQCWMAKNLNTTHAANGASITRYCYNNDNHICDNDGGLYDWPAIMNGSAGCNGVCSDTTLCNGAGDYRECRPYVQGICPTGWHIPSHFEWTLLEKSVGTSPGSFVYNSPMVIQSNIGINEGRNLQSTLTDKNGPIAGRSGFNAIPAGISASGVYAYRTGLNGRGIFWTSTSQGGAVCDRLLTPFNQGVTRALGDTTTTYDFSLRCIRD